MSTASFVPETRGLDLSDAAGDVAVGELLKDSLLRFRRADGLSFARSLAFQVVFALFPAVIATVAVAVRLGEGRFQALIREAITSLAPGPAGDIFLTAFEQGSSNVGRANLVAIGVGGVAALTSGVAGMAQLQRGSNRLYGLLDDRSTKKRYLLATVLTLTVGMLFVAAFLAIVLGSSAVGALQDDVARLWTWIRWPVGVVALTVAFAGLFKVAPNRHQPPFGWLALGGAVAVVGWLAVSVGLAVYLNASTTFGETYGPLAGFMGLMIWAQMSAVAVFYGLAVAAQLEAVRAGVPSPVAEQEKARKDGGEA